MLTKFLNLKLNFDDFLKLICVFILYSMKGHDLSSWAIILLTIMGIIFSHLRNNSIFWMLTNLILLVSFLNNWYSFQEYKIILFIVINYIIAAIVTKKQKLLLKQLSLYLSLIMLASGAGKAIYGSYFNGDSVIELMYKDRRVSSLYTLVFSKEDSKIHHDKQLAKTSNIASSKSLMLSKNEQILFPLIGKLIIFFEMGIGFILLISYYNSRYINIAYNSMIVFTLVLYPIIPVIPIGALITIICFGASYAHDYRLRNAFILLFIYVLACKIRYIL